MAADELLHDDQFGNTTYTAPNKRTYTIRQQGRLVEALTPSGRAAGRMSYFSKGLGGRPNPEIYKVIVSKPHRRKGVASAMLEMAQRRDPNLSHSPTLSPEGAAWARATPLPGDSPETKASQRRVLEG